MAPIADERLEPARGRSSRAAKVTPAAARVTDVPGTGPQLLGNLRRVDALLEVADGFSAGADPDGRPRAARAGAAGRRPRPCRAAARARGQAGEVGRREAAPGGRRAASACSSGVDAGRSLRDWEGELPPELEPLTTKPVVPVVNGPAGIDLKLEAELAELPEEEAAEFREGESALDEVVHRLFEALGLITFFTAGETEARGWTLRRGQTALEAAAAIHTDIARGFIRAEVVRWSDLVELGSYAEVARRGLQRLEGKTYEVQDGDVLTVRFNVPATGNADAGQRRTRATTSSAAASRTSTDGRMFIAGGNKDQQLNGIVQTHLFDPATNTWSLGPNMAGRALVSDGHPAAQRRDADHLGPRRHARGPRRSTARLRALSTASLSLPLYPWIDVAPNGTGVLLGPRSDAAHARHRPAPAPGRRSGSATRSTATTAATRSTTSARCSSPAAAPRRRTRGSSTSTARPRRSRRRRRWPSAAGSTT